MCSPFGFKTWIPASFVLAFILIGVAIVLCIPVMSYNARSTKASGTVVKHMKFQNDSGIVYRLQLNFVDRSGARHEFLSKIAVTDPTMYPDGSSVPVLYDTSQPADARVGVFMFLWFWPVLFLSLGILQGGVGIILIVARAYVKRKVLV